MGARRLDKLAEVQKIATEKYPESPGTLIFKQCDVTQRESVCDLVKEAEENLGEVDILINCAGVMFFTEMKNGLVDQWEKTVDVNEESGMPGNRGDRIAPG